MQSNPVFHGNRHAMAPKAGVYEVSDEEAL